MPLPVDCCHRIVRSGGGFHGAAAHLQANTRISMIPSVTLPYVTTLRLASPRYSKQGQTLNMGLVGYRVDEYGEGVSYVLSST